MRKVYYKKFEDRTEIAIADDGVLQHFYKLENGFLTGSIFTGKVMLVKKQVGVFVDIGLEKDGLLSYRDGLKPGDIVLVQVKKEPTETKGCALTEKITLPGRYAVLNDVGEYKFSSKISDEKKIELFGVERKEGIGFIFRSACEFAEKEAIFTECKELTEKYEKLKKEAIFATKISCIYRDGPESVARRFALDDDLIFEGFDEIEKDIKSIGERKVYSSGVEMVFDKTEAMTVVDVNFHKFDGKYKDIEEGNFQANVIAVKEIARQIRLRNVGGIIMVDIISLKDRENFAKLKEIFEAELSKDNVKTSLEPVEKIGMFAIVRKIRFASV